MRIPKGHHTVMPYLILKGTDEFLAFAINVFEARETQMNRRSDNSIMHGEIMIGDSTIMFGESNDDWQPVPASLFIYAEDVDDRYHKAISNGAQSILPPEDKGYGRTCGVLDKSGNSWWITAPPKA